MAVCPQHPGSHVVCHERRPTKAGVRQVFRCRPVGAEAPHRFTVLIAAGVPVPVWSPPPRCPEHETGKVVRDGRYGRSTARPRQRYRCYPDPADPKVYHRFTPWLPRDHVHPGEDRCGECEELRGTHRGDQAVSRRQSWSARVVAEALRELARGATYAEVTIRSRQTTSRTRSRAGAAPPAPGTARERKNRWHTAADWVETFAPVLWDHVEPRLRAEAEAAVAARDELRAAGKHNPQPVTIVIDDVPVHTKWVEPETRKRSSRMIYSVLVVSEIHWQEQDGRLDRAHKLRLVRACPNNDRVAWKLASTSWATCPTSSSPTLTTVR